MQSLRTVLGVGAIGGLRGLAGALRLLGAGCRYLGRFLVDVYDIVIFLPLWLEFQVKARAGLRWPATGKSRDLTDDEPGLSLSSPNLPLNSQSLKESS